jgi:hypothetical protein
MSGNLNDNGLPRSVVGVAIEEKQVLSFIHRPTINAG